MNLDLSNRCALITGGSAGLGFATALEFARYGAHVIIVARNGDRLARAVDQLRTETGAQIEGVAADVTDRDAISNMYAQIAQRRGGVDILVNNAGGSARGSIETLSEEAWQADFEIKLFSAIRLCRLVLPHMRAQRWGRIINIVNTLAKTPGAGTAPTSVSRAAGVAFTKVLAHEVSSDNILVNAICVGRIDSEQWRRFHRQSGASLDYADYLADEGRAIPLGRLGRPDEFAGLLCLLASEAGGYITGTAINVDGGLSPAV
jgi:NAD(P)-dependent dehydrogenase (short-subunit alcohol dehydrogenase family)